MATLAEKRTDQRVSTDMLSRTPRANALDRWIFVFMAAWFVVIILTAFVPDSLTEITAVEAGERPRVT